MEIVLQAGEMLCLKGTHCGLQLNCREGAMWITQKGDSRDHTLGKGNCFQSVKRGKIVATALRPSRILIEHQASEKNRHAARPLRVAVAR